MFHNYCEVQRPAAKLSVNDDTTYGCDMCDSGGWLSETEVEMHKKSVHLRQLTRLISSELNICRTCVKSFPDHNALIEHIKFKHFHSSKTARRIEREIFVCDHCYQIFFNKQMLEVHIVHRHMKKPHSILLDCPLCLKKKSSQVMYNHMMHHNSHSVSVCPICLHKQRNRKALAQHLDTHRKHYHCNICGYISTKEKDFNMHLDTYERRKRSFKVKNYKKCFLKPFPTHRWSYNCLKVGLQGLIIFNEIYICVLCRQLCTNHTDMQEHILRDHSSEPDTTETVAKKVCSCGEQFSNVILLKHHIFKNKGQCRLSYTEIDQSAGEDSSDEELAVNSENEEVNPVQELIYQYAGSEDESTGVALIVTDTQNLQSDTQNEQSDTQNVRSDTHNVESDTRNVVNDTQNVVNLTQNDDIRILIQLEENQLNTQIDEIENQ